MASDIPDNDDIRIVAVNAHHDSGEIEIVLEVTEHELFSDKTKLVSCWVDKREVIKRIIQEQNKC